MTSHAHSRRPSAAVRDRRRHLATATTFGVVCGAMCGAMCQTAGGALLILVLGVGGMVTLALVEIRAHARRERRLRPVVLVEHEHCTVTEPSEGRTTAIGIDIDERNGDLAQERVGMFLTVEQLDEAVPV